ncbi:hypothetical protein AMS68_007794 [Peltaster fructicola]|uniref:Ecp2 effector protein domain-containing protein n=1 Tax=Peltaster fructicola TaxID=286661 RepID=A0A6H0Y5F2_9PEZI|nr:hypothetical protein AMS68_007794 [Peltaster fructicola]
MHSQSIILPLLAIFSMASAKPVAAPAPVPATGDVPCDNISKYSVQWFTSNMCRPTPASCLFYTKGLSAKARSIAKIDGAQQTTIWELWPTSLYNRADTSKQNPLRCIMLKKDTRSTYFSHMSEAMAKACTISADVLDANYKSPRTDGIWGQTEYPALTNGGKINFIRGVEPSTLKSEIIWRKKGTRDALADSDDTFEAVDIEYHDPANATEIYERSSCGVGADVAAAFDAGGDHAVDW